MLIEFIKLKSKITNNCKLKYTTQFSANCPKILKTMNIINQELNYQTIQLIKIAQIPQNIIYRKLVKIECKLVHCLSAKFSLFCIQCKQLCTKCRNDSHEQKFDIDIFCKVQDMSGEALIKLKTNESIKLFQFTRNQLQVSQDYLKSLKLNSASTMFKITNKDSSEYNMPPGFKIQLELREITFHVRTITSNKYIYGVPYCDHKIEKTDLESKVFINGQIDSYEKTNYVCLKIKKVEDLDANICIQNMIDIL